VTAPAAGLQQIVPAQVGERTVSGGRRLAAGQQHVAQVVARRQHGGEQRQAFAGGEQRADIAVAHDVGHLISLEQRIERHEDATGGGCAETGDDRFEALFEVDRDALAALQAEADEAGDEAVDRPLQLAVAHRLLAVAERDGVRIARGGVADQFDEQACISHFSGAK